MMDTLHTSIEATQSVAKSILGIICEYAALMNNDTKVTYDYRFTALHNAAGTGDMQTVEDCLKRGEFVDQYCNVHSLTPLVWAVWNGHSDMVQFLVINGARRHVRALVKILKGQTKCMYYDVMHMKDNAKGDMLNVLLPCFAQDPLKEVVLALLT